MIKIRNIIVVECGSTGKNFIQDIVDRNYYPVILETKTLDDSFETRRYKNELKSCYDSLNNDFDLIFEKDSYDETLQMVKEYDPLLIIPATEKGVILANRLSHDLNLLGNPIENIDAMTLKDKMHERLAENNLRSIKGKVISSIEEAIDFYEGEGLKKVVVKPLYSAGSVGVRLCNDKRELINAIEEVFKLKGFYGNDLNELLIQEMIEGEEYIVNTVSCDGIHRVTSVWKYKKSQTSEGGRIVDYSEAITSLDIGEADLVEYAFDVADAIGIKYGAVHGEFMVDENGPVLIEVNCRAMGANLDAEYLNKVFGHHETDCILDSYLNPDKFYSERKKGYRTFAYAFIKIFIVPNDLIAKSSPISKIGINLKSHYKTSMNMGNEYHLVTKTQDLETAGGSVYLVNSDYKQIKDDLEFLRKIERRAFELVLSEEKNQTVNIDVKKIEENINVLLDNIKSYGTSLLVTENIFEDINTKQVTVESIDEIKGEFDCVIVHLNESINDETAEDISKLFLKIFDKVKMGGLIFIPNTTYEYVPNGRLGMEALLKLLDFNLEMPIHKLTRMVVAKKEESRFKDSYKQQRN